MAGCFGDNFWDRSMEMSLNFHLNSLDVSSIECQCGWSIEKDFEFNVDELEILYNEENDYDYINCPNCKEVIVI
jgi:hypothetical protein